VQTSTPARIYLQSEIARSVIIPPEEPRRDCAAMVGANDA
jgi:hypothetical protein